MLRTALTREQPPLKMAELTVENPFSEVTAKTLSFKVNLTLAVRSSC